MFTKDACYANGWWICCGGAMCPQLMDEALEVTSGSGWSGIGAESCRAVMPANLSSREQTDLEEESLDGCG